MKNLTILLILFSSFCFSQTVTTKFIRSGFLADSPEISSNTTCKFKANKEVGVFDYVGFKWWKVKYKDCEGYVTDSFILVSNELIELRKEYYFKQDSLKRNRKSLKRKQDSLKKVEFERKEKEKDSIKKSYEIRKENERKLLDSILRNVVNYVKDSSLVVTLIVNSEIKKKPSIFAETVYRTKLYREVIVLDYDDNFYKVCLDTLSGYVSKFEISTKRLNNSKIASKVLKEFKRIREVENEERLRKSKLEKYFNECSYTTNEKDEFTGIIRKITSYYNIDEFEIFNTDLKIRLRRYGSSKYVEIKSSQDLGCTSPYSTNKSSVKFKLENGDIVTFYHKGDIDCGNFNLLGLLTGSDISRLKKSPIKTVRLSGTEYYHDVTNLFFKNFFIKKLDCVK